MKNLKRFGRTVQEGRERKNITQQQLANEINVSKEIIDDIENGEYDILLDEAFDIKKALDIPVTSLLDLFDENEDEVLMKLHIIGYSDELGTDNLMDLIKSMKKK